MHITGAVGHHHRIVVTHRIVTAVQVKQTLEIARRIVRHVGKGRVDIGLGIEVTGLAEPAGTSTIEVQQQIITVGRIFDIELKRRAAGTKPPGRDTVPALIQLVQCRQFRLGGSL